MGPHYSAANGCVAQPIESKGVLCRERVEHFSPLSENRVRAAAPNAEPKSHTTSFFSADRERPPKVVRDEVRRMERAEDAYPGALASAHGSRSSSARADVACPVAPRSTKPASAARSKRSHP